MEDYRWYRPLPHPHLRLGWYRAVPSLPLGEGLGVRAETPPICYPTPTMTSLADLDQELRRIGREYSGTWTYARIDIASGEQIGFDSDDVMPTASLIKVPILNALYQAVHEGKLALDDRTTYREEHRCLGSGVLERLTPGVEMSVRDAAVLMIIISDNSATNMVIDLMGLDYINEQLRRLGLEQTAIFQRLGEQAQGLDARTMSVSTAAEMTKLLALIARHEAVSPSLRRDRASGRAGRRRRRSPGRSWA